MVLGYPLIVASNSLMSIRILYLPSNTRNGLSIPQLFEAWFLLGVGKIGNCRSQLEAIGKLGRSLDVVTLVLVLSTKWWRCMGS